MSLDSLLHCPFCMGWLGEPSLAETGHWEGICTRCQRATVVEVYPSILKQNTLGKAGQTTVDDSQSTCMKHPAKQAVEACSQCGRFMCETCRIDLGNTAMCPECMERGLKGQLKTTTFVQMLKRNELAVPALLLFPLYIGLILAWLSWLGEAEPAEAIIFGVFMAAAVAFIVYPAAAYLRFRSGRTPAAQLPNAGLAPIPVAVRPWLGAARPFGVALGFRNVPILEIDPAYWAEDYFLIVRKSGVAERYQRIFYKDICGIRIQRRTDPLIGFLIVTAATAILLVSTMYTVVLAPAENPIAAATLALFLAWFAWVVMSNRLRGRACHVDLFTPVSRIRIESIGRWAPATRFLSQISARIAQQQGAWQPGPGVELRMLNFRHKPTPKPVLRNRR